MAKSSKKRDADRKAKRIAWEIARVEQSDNLPQKVAIPEHLDGLNYQLIFDRYNHKECELNELDSKSAELLIKKFSSITRYNSKSIAGSNLIRDNVARAGQYKNLYVGIEPEIQIKEIQFSGNGRVFCYLVDDYPQDSKTSNYCCIIAIKRQHIN